MSKNKASAQNLAKDIAEEAPLWTKSFIYICLVNLFIFGALQVILPTLPVYVQELGGKEADVGLIIGLFTFTAMLSRPISGLILDRWGRKSLLLLALFVYALFSYSYILASSVLVLILIRLIHGAAWGVATTAAGTVVTDLLPPRRLGEGMGYFSLTSAVSMATFPALGLFMIEKYDFLILFLFSMGIAFLGLFFALLIRYPSPTEQRVEAVKAQAGGNKVALFLRKFFEPQAYGPAVVMFFITSTFGAIISFIALYADQLKIGQVGLFFTFYAVTLILGRPYAGRQVDQGHIDKIVASGLLLIIVSLLLLSQTYHVATLMISGAIYGLGIGFTMPALQTLSVIGVPYHRRGTANGTFFSFFDLGIGLGAIGWGYVAMIVGYRTMYGLTAIPVVIAGLLYFFNKKKILKEQNKEN
ncbi:MFS transporter [Heliorestis acidaminivorans]|uniref:MFS transporter n=1 Tax=Heliorestis acidaminivorans TaxID=553427 RepID=UPI0014798042|nr:MFS transporter [Heliorestis acidaminivorans]